MAQKYYSVQFDVSKETLAMISSIYGGIKFNPEGIEMLKKELSMYSNILIREQKKEEGLVLKIKENKTGIYN